ncbi:hypothetical protein B0H11DRAFT_1930375 [Mycena galericulata]|nr:hypothetical protein B0H11DRAFT_1930375 [Mycena galericulata]
MSQTWAERATELKQKRRERQRRRKHAEAEQRYREKWYISPLIEIAADEYFIAFRNADVLREKARLRMQRHRATVKQSEEGIKLAREQRREVDADYRERNLWLYTRKRQKQFIQKFGKARFEDTYVPLYKVHGNQTGKLKFQLESKAASEARMDQENSHNIYCSTPTMWASTLATDTVVPPSLVGLAPPPASFVPCLIPNYLDNNFTDHIDFSRRRNKTYWVLFVSSKQGMYSLKKACMAAKDSRYTEEEVIGSFQHWSALLPVWATHCYHRHSKCSEHRNACAVGACPDHPAPPDPTPSTIRVRRREPVSPGVKRESVKRESATAEVKRESSSTPNKRGRGVKLESTMPPIKSEAAAFPVKRGDLSVRNPNPRTARRPPPSYTPVPETDSESDGPAVPLYDSDSSEEGAVQAARPLSASLPAVTADRAVPPPRITFTDAYRELPPPAELGLLDVGEEGKAAGGEEEQHGGITR